MPLTLKILSKQKHILGSDSVRVFSVHGGTVGRASDNDWMLPDPDRYISAHHAAIDYRDGAYYLRDTSTNGVFVNRSEQPVGAGAPIRLYDGDELRMGDYIFQAYIVDVSGNVGDEPGDGEPRVRLRRKQEDPAELSLKLLGEEAEARNEQMKEGEDPAALEIWSDEQFGSTVRLTNEEIDTKVPVDHGKVAQLRNEDSARYRTDDQLSLGPVPDKPRAAPESAGRRDFTEAVRLLLEHAGLDYSQLPRGEEEEQVLALIGRMVRNTTAGLQSLLRNRALTKGQFRIAQTGMRPAANNPLKLMSDTQEALEQMFYENSDAYLGPDAAV
ncbi:MAG TPA: type VI secretion system-associated FHA domain protein TagH, partial [Gammaproteobacteria bacterium]|nr:type VI secretion system-associated FHA domain protein TagH [Gammaproteobacteria bacterium]